MTNSSLFYLLPILVHQGGEAPIGPDRCGPIALAICAERIGITASVAELDRAAGAKGIRTNLADLQSAAHSSGFMTKCLQWTAGEAPIIPLAAPAIVPVRLQNGSGHFIAAVAATDEKILISDFGRELRWVRLDSLRTDYFWDGVLLYVFRNPQIESLLDHHAESPLTVWICGVVFMAILMVAIGTRARTRHRSDKFLSRGGFTVVELVVSIGIISVLMAILVPAVQSFREAARRIKCTNNLRQIGLACGAAEATSRKTPPASQVSRDTRTGRTKSSNRSIHVELLPFLEQANLFESYDRMDSGLGVRQDPPYTKENAALLSVRLPVFVCPSDPSPIIGNSYRICTGTSPGLHETTDQTPINQALNGFRGMTGRRDPRISDGRSNTAAFCERVAGDGDATVYSPWSDIRQLSVRVDGLKTPDDVVRACTLLSYPDPKHVSFAGSTWVLSGFTQTWYNHIFTPNSRITDCTDGGPESNGAYSARSYHHGSVNLLLLDGSVRAVNSAIDVGTWRAIGTISGGEVVNQF